MADKKSHLASRKTISFNNLVLSMRCAVEEGNDFIINKSLMCHKEQWDRYWKFKLRDLIKLLKIMLLVELCSYKKKLA